MSRALYAVINPVVKFILRSPVHGLMSHNTLVLEFKDRSSAKTYSTAVSYPSRMAMCITSPKRATSGGATSNTWTRLNGCHSRKPAFGPRLDRYSGLSYAAGMTRRRGPLQVDPLVVGLPCAGSPVRTAVAKE